jgi:hypothetical protein
VTNAPDVELPAAGGPWSTPVDFRKFGTETFTVDARCVWYRSDVASVTLTYKTVPVTVALGPLVPKALPAPSVPGRPRFTG